MKQLTRKEAIYMYDNGDWKHMTLEQRAKFQFLQEKLCMPFDKFHEAIEKTLKRPVYTHEFALNREGLHNELFGDGDPPSMEELIEMLPENKTIVATVRTSDDDGNVGIDVITREEALKISKNTMDKAERERLEHSDDEARKGIQVDE